MYCYRLFSTFESKPFHQLLNNCFDLLFEREDERKQLHHPLALLTMRFWLVFVKYHHCEQVQKVQLTTHVNTSFMPISLAFAAIIKRLNSSRSAETEITLSSPTFTFLYFVSVPNSGILRFESVSQKLASVLFIRLAINSSICAFPRSSAFIYKSLSSGSWHNCPRRDVNQRHYLIILAQLGEGVRKHARIKHFHKLLYVFIISSYPSK